MNPNYNGQVVVVTGASAGVGRATAKLFAQHGAKVALLARGKEGLAGAEREVRAAGGEALTIPVDVADFSQVHAAAQQVEQEFGPIDIWINNAMVSVFSPFKEMSPEEFRRVTEVTYLGAVHGTLAALKVMLPRNRGSIVQVGSALAYRGIPLQSAYCGAKHAINGFTESLRCELLHDKSAIKLSMVQLPALNTPQFSWVKSRLSHKSQPVPPIYQPELAAKAILWAAHHNRREVYVGMSTLKAIWADKFVPGLLDRYLGRTGYRSQQTDEPKPKNAPNNLMAPVDEDRDLGTHGTFDDRSAGTSLQLWFTLNRDWIALAAGAASLIAGFLFYEHTRQSKWARWRRKLIKR